MKQAIEELWASRELFSSPNNGQYQRPIAKADKYECDKNVKLAREVSYKLACSLVIKN